MGDDSKSRVAVCFDRVKGRVSLLAISLNPILSLGFVNSVNIGEC